jgi:cytoskeletal protein CcmA (bactofilin family)
MKLSISRAVPIILSSDFTFEGNIIGEGEIHVFGALKGNLTARKLTLGEGGTIEGKIQAESVVLNGNFSGNLFAKSVVMGRTASVTADIVYQSMEMESGAVYDGHARQVLDAQIISSEVVELPITKREQIEKVRASRK